MPKGGIKLTETAIETIQSHLKNNKMTQEQFAKNLKVTPRTMTNWLSGSSKIDYDKLHNLTKVLGVGIEDLLGTDLKNLSADPDQYTFHYETHRAIYLAYKTGLARNAQKFYRKISNLFSKNISFLLIPRKGFFQSFEHDAEKKKNYYFQFWIQSEEEVTEAKFTISYTLGGVIRINYGEIIIKSDRVEIVQYYQPPNFYVRRPTKDVCTAKVATWLDEMSHTFVVASDTTKFKIVEKGEISEEEIKEAGDIAYFPKHFFFHQDI